MKSQIEEPIYDEIDEIRMEGIENKDGIWIDGMGDTDSSIIKQLQKTDDELKSEVFWYSDTNGRKEKVAIDYRKYFIWLKRQGLCLLRDGKGKTSNFEVIGITDGIIDKENEDTIRVYTYEYFEDQPSSYWDDENQYGVYKQGKSGDMWCKIEVMDKLFNLSFNRNTFSANLLMSWNSFDYNTLPTLMDNAENVYIPFENKIVHISKNKMDMIDYDTMKKKGNIWKSQIINHKISERNRSEEGVFEKFCRLATSRRKNVVLAETQDWTDSYETDDESLKSLRTAYGYLISGYNNPSQPVAPIFIDGDAEIGMEEGRNGKSAIMYSMKHWKKMSYQSGKSYQSIKTSGGRFQYSNVDIDTKFVFLNDTPEWFDMEEIYDRLSDDFEVSGKYTNKFVIPQDKKPKMGITTNYPPIQKGGSARHRMHITPFGNYWLNVKENNEEPYYDKHLGKMMFQSDFNYDDYNDFYHYGFDCVQQYLKEGLHRCNTDRVKVKGLITKWEDGSDDGVVRWFVDVVENERIKEMTITPGIAKKKLHNELMKSLATQPQVKFKWINEEGRFQKMIWDVCKSMGYKYNDHKSHMGDTQNIRKYIVKGEYHIVIKK